MQDNNIRTQIMNIQQVTKTLEMLNQVYNQLYIRKKQNNEKETHNLMQIQKIFSYLDDQGNIHLRLSSLFFLTGALLICQNYQIPINYTIFKVHFLNTIQNMCHINGIVSLRCFKNYFLNHPQKRILCHNLMGIFQQCQKNCNLLSSNKKNIHHENILPNIMQQAIIKWRSFPRFSGGSENRKKIEIYKRLFQQNQTLLFLEDQGIKKEHFITKYGQQFTKCFEIDDLVLNQINIVMKQCLNKYVSILAKVGNSYHKTNQNIIFKQSTNSNSHISYENKRNKKNTETVITKNHHKNNRTPKKKQNKNHDRARTPTNRKTSPFIYRQFGSAQRSPSKNRPTTPTKTMSGLYTSGKIIGSYRNKEILQKDGFHEKLFFFRNKRVESYEVVMKRLKGK